MSSALIRLAPIPLRLTLGIIMMAHGQDKVFGQAKEHFPNVVGTLDVPRPEHTARFVSYLEFFGGLALIAGLFTRLVALLFAGQFAFITFKMKWSNGLVKGYEFDLALLGGFLSLVFLGSGSGALDDIF